MAVDLDKLLTELTLAGQKDFLPAIIKVKKCSIHHLQLRDESDTIVADWWPGTGKVRIPESSETRTGIKTVNTLISYLKEL